MKKTLLLALCLLSITAFADSSKIRFNDGWIKQLPPVIPMRAGYVEIENKSAQNHEIIAFESAAFDSVEMHESLMQDGVMKMIQLQSIALPAQGKVSLKPGGKHLMLLTPQQPLQIGDRIAVTVSFADGSSQTIKLEVQQ